MKLHTIDTGLFKLDGGAMHGVVPKSLWNKLNPADENNLCSWAMRCLLIEEGNRLILVDTGIGEKQDAKFMGHYYLHGAGNMIQSIKNAGFSPEDITDVFLTHLHFDHVGGAVKRADEKLMPTFKNATYWSNSQHWEWAINPNDREKASFLKENILPIQESGQLQFFDGKDGAEFMPGFKVRLVNGHTESMMLPQLDYKGHTLLYCADLFPSINHIPLPWVMAYDTRPLETLKEKKKILAEAIDGDWLLYFEHDAVNEICSLSGTERGVRSKETFQLSAL
ncbi:MAG TPA: MBL fold metallo-hydrolase [Edaphocola sp.]|nr:MBL fold metallo-hydrolase [Edaphocola sp.]